MLVIRREQIRALSDARVQQFVNRMIRHHQKFFPQWSGSLGDEKLEAFVWHGIKRANQHGFEVELHLARYLHVMQSLGKHFDESPEYPWAHALLKTNLPVEEKMNRLMDAALYETEARRISSGY